MSKSYKLSGDGNYIDSTGIVHNKTALSNYLYSKSNNLTTTSTGNVLDAYQGYVLKNRIDGVVLYNNSSGTTGTVNLSQSAQNFVRIEFEYMNLNGECNNITEAWVRSDKNEVVMDDIESGMQSTLYCKIGRIKFTTTSVTWDSNDEITLNISGRGSFSKNNPIKIYKVIGYAY